MSSFFVSQKNANKFGTEQIIVDHRKPNRTMLSFLVMVKDLSYQRITSNMPLKAEMLEISLWCVVKLQLLLTTLSCRQDHITGNYI